MSQRSTRPALYKGYRFPPEIISRCVWLSYRFGVSLRDVSELMPARGIEVSHERTQSGCEQLDNARGRSASREIRAFRSGSGRDRAG